MEGSDASLTTKDRGNLLLHTRFGRSASQTTPFHRSVVIRNQINQKFASKPVFAAVRGIDVYNVIRVLFYNVFSGSNNTYNAY